MVAGAAGDDGMGGDWNEYFVVTIDAEVVAGTAVAGDVMVKVEDVSDSGSSQTYCGNYNLSVVGRGYSCSSTDSH